MILSQKLLLQTSKGCNSKSMNTRVMVLASPSDSDVP